MSDSDEAEMARMRNKRGYQVAADQNMGALEQFCGKNYLSKMNNQL